MVKAASGYLTKDGRFFPDQTAAELNEAEVELVDAINRDADTPDSDMMLDRIRRYHKQIARYIFALDKSNDLSAKGPREAHVSPRLDKGSKTTPRKSSKVNEGRINDQPSEGGVKSV